MKTVLLLVAALAWGIQANSRMESNRPAQYVQKSMSYVEGFFQDSNWFSNDDGNYFPSSTAFSNNREITYLTRILKRWMLQTFDVLSEIVNGIKLLTKAFRAFKLKPKEEKMQDTETEIAKNETITTPQATTPQATTPSINYDTALFVGASNSNYAIDIYDYAEDTKSFQMRSSVETESRATCLVTDATKLITVGQPRGEKKALEVFDLNEGVGKPVAKNYDVIKGSSYRYATLDSSGKYLLAVNFNSDNVTAIELMDDGSLNTVATYAPKDDLLSKGLSSVKFHPKAKGVLAAVYRNLNLVRFLRFDSTTKTLTLLEKEAKIKSAYDMVFSDDGNYMFLCNTKNKLYTFKITVDIDSNDVTGVEDYGGIDIVQDAVSLSDSLIVISKSSEFIYVLTEATNSVAMFKNDPSTGKQIYIGLQATGGRRSEHMAISPGGTQLLVADSAAGIFVFDIIDDGKLFPLSTINGTAGPYRLLFSRKQ